MDATFKSFDAGELGSRNANWNLVRDRINLWALAILTVIAFIPGIVVLAVRWNDPLLGMHSFRQTQTAITSYWILKGSPWLAYHTPVFGAPWSIPFEFPMYQLLVAGVVKMTGLPLDPAGRLVSYLFLLATIWPIRSIARSYGLSDENVTIFAILFLASPIYLYWGSTFLIETTVLFFCVAFLAAIIRTIDDDNSVNIAAAALLGAIGAIGKITTFAPFYLLAGVLLLFHLLILIQRGLPLRPMIRSSVAAMLPAPLLFALWDRFADAQKARNPIGRFTMSTAPMMHPWTFGTCSQLFSERMIYTLIRGVTDTIGVLSIVVFTSLILLCRHHGLSKQRMVLVAAALLGFFFPYLIFTNLHVVHNYYDTANAIFLIIAVSVIIGGFFSEGHWRSGWATLILTVVSQLTWFHMYFGKDLVHQGDYHLEIAQTIAANTDTDGVIAIYSKDWSPVIPYYAQRRAVMEQTFAPRYEILDRAHDILKAQGGYPIEAVVRCPSPMDNDHDLMEILAPQLARLYRHQIGDCEVYFRHR